MKKEVIVFLISLSFLCPYKIFSQISSGGIPVYIKQNLADTNVAIPKITLSYINNDIEILRADSIGNAICSECKSNYYGRGIDVSIDVKNTAQFQTVNGDTSKLWLLEVEDVTAYGMAFFFNKFKIPDGATLFFYNEDKSVILGAFTSDNNPTDSTQVFQFATQYIPGNKIFIEYNEPKDADFAGELQISKVIHGFKNIFDKSGPFGSSGSCEINVACPLGVGWENEIKSVGILLYYNSDNELSGFCSGALINNTHQDGRAFFLTANHCVDDGSGGLDPSWNTWLVLFNHQTTTCASNGSDVSAYTGQSVNISSILIRDANSLTSDYCLMELNAIPSSFGVCYAGWDNVETNASSSSVTIGIHHPQGDVKKISKDNDSPCSSGYTQSCNSGNYHWRVQWNNNSNEHNGVTEGGSSGSPLFNSNHKIIGQLHGGASDCSNEQGADYYGKFSDSWTNSGATGFAFYLDPYNTGNHSVDTYCPATTTGGGNTGGNTGGGGITCSAWISDGMMVNGAQADIPCISGDIVLKPLPRQGCNNTWWAMMLTTKKQKAEDVAFTSYCHFSLYYWKYYCSYIEYFIEIAEVDNNFNQIGTVHSKWISIQFDDPYLSKSTPLWDQVVVSQSDLSTMGVTLQSGKIYRIKLAQSAGGWKETVRYFRAQPTDIYLSSTNVTSNLLGIHVTLENVTMNNVTVIATNSITILPGSTINNSILSIGNTPCPVYKWNPYSNENNDNSNNNTKQSENTEEIPKPIINYANQLLQNNPNPASSTTDIMYSIKDASTVSITLYNIFGQKVGHLVDALQQEAGTYKITMDASNLAYGVYFYTLEVQGKGDVYRETKRMVVLR